MSSVPPAVDGSLVLPEWQVGSVVEKRSTDRRSTFAGSENGIDPELPGRLPLETVGSDRHLVREPPASLRRTPARRGSRSIRCASVRRRTFDANRTEEATSSVLTRRLSLRWVRSVAAHRTADRSGRGIACGPPGAARFLSECGRPSFVGGHTGRWVRSRSSEGAGLTRLGIGPVRCGAPAVVRRKWRGKNELLETISAGFGFAPSRCALRGGSAWTWPVLDDRDDNGQPPAVSTAGGPGRSGRPRRYHRSGPERSSRFLPRLPTDRQRPGSTVPDIGSVPDDREAVGSPARSPTDRGPRDAGRSDRPRCKRNETPVRRPARRHPSGPGAAPRRDASRTGGGPRLPADLS